MTNKELLQLIEQAARDEVTELNLMEEGLTRLSPAIGQLIHLNELDLSRNKLTTIPPEIGQLSSLAKLDLSFNQLTSLPPQISQLVNLTELDLRGNNLTTLPPEIAQLTELTILKLSGNPLATFPLEIGKLTNLKGLGLTGNRLTTFPLQITKLSNLTWLYLDENRIIELPSEIGQLANLRELSINKNQLTRLPPEIGQLFRLTYLDLRNNRLTLLPSQVGALSSLIMLYLSGNGLVELPPEIGQLTNLEGLYLGSEMDEETSIFSRNSLTNLPPEIGQLSNLKWLKLDGNQLNVLLPEIGQLSKLEYLDVSYNKLVTLPHEIGHLSNLAHFYLNDNSLITLPPQIGHLSKLTKLGLTRNQLTTLPSEISQLSKLTALSLRDNPLSIPLEILEAKDNPATILNYYHQLQTSQPKSLNEAKLLLVGEPEVGKTSLVNRLIENNFNPTENKTEGIAIHRWPLTLNGQQIRLNVWDFGGQEIMHATHQFFLTKRSLYLLVLDARSSEEQNRLEYWLKMIASFGGESPVIVVGNKIDQQPLDLDKRGLMLKYPQIRAIIETSCLDGRGLAELQAAIEREVAALPHVNDQLLQSWFNVKTRLEGLDRDFVPYHEYLHMCQAEGVGDDLSQRTLIGFLHDLGVALNFQDDPRLEETNILNPEWVTGGVYKILNDPDLMTEHHGALERARLNRILDPQRYPRDKHLFIVDMMRKFELCFDFEGFTDRKFLIPDLLPKEEPDTGSWTGALAFQYHYSVLPGSIISRFIVRMNHLIHRQTYWRNGVMLAYEDRGTQTSKVLKTFEASSTGNTALVKADREDRKIFIWVAGPESGRRRFLSIIRAQFDAIHRTIPGLEVEEKVPLPDHSEIVVDYQYLRDLEEMGETHFVPPGLRQRVSVKTLLDGIEAEETRRAGTDRISRQEELQRLIRNSFRRLQKLKEEEALKGKSASLSLEIEDIEIEIKNLQMELRAIE